MQARLPEKARHEDTVAKLAEPRLRPLPARERKGKLRVASTRSMRHREPSAETDVDIGDLVPPAIGQEALDVRRTDDPERLGDLPSELDQGLILGSAQPFTQA